MATAAAAEAKAINSEIADLGEGSDTLRLRHWLKYNVKHLDINVMVCHDLLYFLPTRNYASAGISRLRVSVCHMPVLYQNGST